MTLIIDNYDSFTYNLYQLAGMFAPDIRVVLSDKLTVSDIAAMQPERVILSPGPGRPKDGGVCEAAVRCFAGKLPILCVRLGHQAICEAFGAEITYAGALMHGKSSMIHIAGGSPGPAAADSGGALSLAGGFTRIPAG